MPVPEHVDKNEFSKPGFSSRDWYNNKA